MISSVDFSKKLNRLGFDTAIGVPDSTFKGLISYFSARGDFKHIIASNECEASAIAAGYYLGHKKPAMVYMQNSGFCKTLNPYTSLLSKDVYSIPALMLVGWRGEPGKKDEPQHKMMGRIQMDLFNTMEIEHTVLEEGKWGEQLETAAKYLRENEAPYVIAIPKGLFDDFKIPAKEQAASLITREQVLEIIAANSPENAVFISTTGKTSRELFEIREARKENHGKDFYTVGSMGCASSIAFGVGLADSDKYVYVLDGDGAALMQLGSMATVGHYKNNRLKHILMDNNAHESTGGQPTVSHTIDFTKVATACGYEYVEHTDNEDGLRQALKTMETNNRLSLLVVKVKTGSRKDLGRPTTTPKENRDAFIENFG
ncbi:MAG: phosphonopyruvate decarboxylase [bacterium]|nr:phosphonopyruvate decarboxylase [bacterium]